MEHLNIKITGPIRLKPRDKSGQRRMPFLNDRGKRAAAPCWCVPSTGGFHGGYQTGEAMAAVLLKHLRADEAEPPRCCLTQIVESFMIRFEQEGGVQALDHTMPKGWSTEFDSLRGQYLGFFDCLSKWLTASAKVLGDNLDSVSEQDLVNKANAGLVFDMAAIVTSLKAEGKA